MRPVKALIIAGYGINCERETALACEMAGAQAEIVHAQKFFNDQVDWEKCDLLVFPGGFSFGDELGAAKALANRLTYHVSHICKRLRNFVQQGHCILGICNGFQLLVKLGLLPGFECQEVALAGNDTSRFECRWVNHKVNTTVCVFTQGLNQLYLPVRHGEGKFLSAYSSKIAHLFQNGQVALQYADACGTVAGKFPGNPNGSVEAIGGICDPTGRILGMMAHPEAALNFTQHPHWIRIKERLLRDKKPLPQYGDGLGIFKNVINYLGKRP